MRSRSSGRSRKFRRPVPRLFLRLPQRLPSRAVLPPPGLPPPCSAPPCSASWPRSSLAMPSVSASSSSRRSLSANSSSSCVVSTRSAFATNSRRFHNSSSCRSRSYAARCASRSFSRSSTRCASDERSAENDERSVENDERSAVINPCRAATVTGNASMGIDAAGDEVRCSASLTSARSARFDREVQSFFSRCARAAFNARAYDEHAEMPRCSSCSQRRCPRASRPVLAR